MRFRILIFLIIISALVQGASAQGLAQIQAIDGSLAQGQIDVYQLSGLVKGQSLSIFMENTAGNLDPFLAILAATEDLPVRLMEFNQAVAELSASSANPLLELPAVRDQYTLTWDDDSGPGYSAALQFTIPEDGDYTLLAGSSLSAAGRQTYGNYRLLVGLDAEGILDGTAAPTGAIIAVPDPTALQAERIQLLTGSLNANKPKIEIVLGDLNPGDTLYVHVQATSGDLLPMVFLRDYGRKPVEVANLSAQSNNASLQQTFPDGGTNYFLEIIAGSPGGQLTSGNFQLLVGIDTPQVLDGQGLTNTGSLLKLAIPVAVGFKLQQIINIDQPNEIMKAAGTLKLEWTDPELAFDPSTCQCSSKLYTENNFNKFLEDVKGRWPDFTFFNQQGNRWTQNRIIEIEPNGHVSYLERFTTDFQIDFDWSKYPFDEQDFYIHLDMLYSDDAYVFIPMSFFDEIDPQHGEDEFILTDFDTIISTVTSSRLLPTSRFTFHFSAPRHMEYYFFRILVPILLIISVSYITFFLKDYMRRIEIATGNLLLFIAFSFSLGDNYPRMGYLTFLDAIMAITFIINTLVVVLNVYYKWLENNDQREKADRLEAPMNYLYPLAYLISFGLTYLWFFVWA